MLSLKQNKVILINRYDDSKVTLKLGCVFVKQISGMSLKRNLDVFLEVCEIDYEILEEFCGSGVVICE